MVFGEQIQIKEHTFSTSQLRPDRVVQVLVFHEQRIALHSRASEQIGVPSCHLRCGWSSYGLNNRGDDGRWDIYWGPAHILIHPWDGWMSGRGGGGPLVVRISNRQDGGGNELLPGAGAGGIPPTSQDPAAQRQQTNNFSAPCHSTSAFIL